MVLLPQTPVAPIRSNRGRNERRQGIAVRTASEILSAVLAADQDPDTLLNRLCQDCADSLPITGVGMAFITDSGHQGVLAATDGPAAVMEELQFALGEGPCLDASLARRPVLQPDLARTAATRWPGFVPEALNAGIAAIFAFPLHAGAIRIGILDLYRDTPGSPDSAMLAEALAYADAALLVLLHFQSQMPAAGELHPQLVDSIENRAEIHQATGVVSVSAGISLADALLLLRAHAYGAQRPILEVAREVIAGTLRIRSPKNDHD